MPKRYTHLVCVHGLGVRVNDLVDCWSVWYLDHALRKCQKLRFIEHEQEILSVESVVVLRQINGDVSSFGSKGCLSAAEIKLQFSTRRDIPSRAHCGYKDLLLHSCFSHMSIAEVHVLMENR